MSKPISFGFGKPKANNGTSTTDPKSSSFLRSLPAKKTTVNGTSTASRSKSALHSEDDIIDDDTDPKHESVTGFSSSGVILSKPTEEKQELVIENAGNLDWRRRGKNLLPNEVRVAREGVDVVMVEKDEVSTTSGLQFAQAVLEKSEMRNEENKNGPVSPDLITAPRTADEEALQALLGKDDKPKSTVVIEQLPDNQRRPQNETEDFRTDVASRPDSATLADYEAMPVEEFGMAMLRGMGKKRRANGEVINLEQQEQSSRKLRKQEGFLGIGAKPAPGMDAVELGAWGKADMRKNSKGAGFFTPLMMKNKETGETITEEELERRKHDKKANKTSEEQDWRDRRERNLARYGRDHNRNDDDKSRDETNGFSRRHRDESGYDSSRSRKDRHDSDYESSRSQKHRSRSRESSRRDNNESHRHRERDRKRERRRDEYEDDRYESSSSRRDRDRHRDHEGEHRRRNKDYDNNDQRHRDRR